MAKRRSSRSSNRSSGIPAVDMFWHFVESDPKRAVALAFQLGAFAGQMVNKSDLINTGPMKRKFASATGAVADAMPSFVDLARMVPFGLLTGGVTPPSRADAAKGGRTAARKRSSGGRKSSRKTGRKARR